MTNDQLARAAFPTDAIQALRRGNKIEAIKLVRVA